MPRRFLLEPVYSSAEFNRRYPAALRSVGVLLDAAIDGPPPDPEMDRLLERLAEPRALVRH